MRLCLYCLLVSSLLLSSFVVRAQKEATTWYFGNKTGFDFSAGPPRPLVNSARTAGSAGVTLSDKTTGQLLFYSDAAHIWNRQHRLMPHADVQSSNGEYTLQLGPDGRLYGNSGYSDPAVPEVQGQQNMYVINAPNRRDFACDVQYKTFVFGGDSYTASVDGFPAFLESYFNGLEPTPLPAQECAESALGVFPNPTTGVFQLQVPEGCFTPYQMVLYNALGQRVYEQAITTALSGPLDISTLAPSIYFLEAQLAGKNLAK